MFNATCEESMWQTTRTFEHTVFREHPVSDDIRTIKAPALALAPEAERAQRRPLR